MHDGDQLSYRNNRTAAKAVPTSSSVLAWDSVIRHNKFPRKAIYHSNLSYATIIEQSRHLCPECGALSFFIQTQPQPAGRHRQTDRQANGPTHTGWLIVPSSASVRNKSTCSLTSTTPPQSTSLPRRSLKIVDLRRPRSEGRAPTTIFTPCEAKPRVVEPFRPFQFQQELSVASRRLRSFDRYRSALKRTCVALRLQIYYFRFRFIIFL